MLVLLLVLLDADQVLPPEILRHMAGSVGIVSQRLGHLLGNHHQGEDENCHICVAEHDDDYDYDYDYDDDDDDDCTSVKMKPLPARLLGAPYSPGVSVTGTENIIHRTTFLSSVTLSFVPLTHYFDPHHPSDKQAC